MDYEIDPVFLICSERSGSNLIRVMVGAHGSVSALPTLHIMRDVCARMDVMAWGANEGAQYDALMECVTRSLNTHYSQDFTQSTLELLSQITPFTPQGFLRRLYGHLGSSAGQRMVFIKENNLSDMAVQIMDSFPTARFVFQVRDPRDVVTSGLALRDSPLGNKFGSLKNALSIWHEDQTFGLRMLGHLGPKRVFLQRYEDLIANPELVLNGLCTFLDLPFDPEMLSYFEKPQAQEDSQKQRALENISRPVMTQNSNKFIGKLSTQQIEAVEAHLGDLMDRFNYARYCDLSAEQTQAAISWASQSEPAERLANDEWTPFYRLQRKPHHAKLDQIAAPLDFQYLPLDGDR